jgi:hypothetical protein
MFNQTKLKYHKKDILSWCQAIGALVVKDLVNILYGKYSIFKDYGSLLDKFYGSFKVGGIQGNHLFKVEGIAKSLKM